MTSQLEYHVDIVLVIDATASMTPVLAKVKESALSFHGQLTAKLASTGKQVDRLRVRVVTFRDLADDGPNSLAASEFYSLPEEAGAFASWVSSIRLVGGRTFPESGLAGLSVAIHSPWTSGGNRRRHVVVLWTDDEPHLPEHEAGNIPRAFRSQVATSFDELTDLWESDQYSSASAKRLVLFAPNQGAWVTVNDAWTNVILHVSRAGDGVSEYDLEAIMSSIANSV